MPGNSQQPHLIIPLGTKVLTRSNGHIAMIIRAPAAPASHYTIRFPDGSEIDATRDQLTIFRHEHNLIPGAPSQSDLYRFVAYRCIVGSTAYGLASASSDIDRRGFYVPPAHLQWSLAGLPEQLENDNEEVYWEIEKFLRLALKANPNVLECLYSPLVEHADSIAAELLSMREIFLSQHVHRTYNSYVMSQFKKLERDLRNQGQFRWKHVMHLIRLLLSGIVILKEGFVPLRVDEFRDRLLAIRQGEVEWDEVERWRLALHRELDGALATTRLPEQPDYRRADEFLIKARRLALEME